VAASWDKGPWGVDEWSRALPFNDAGLRRPNDHQRAHVGHFRARIFERCYGYIFFIGADRTGKKDRHIWPGSLTQNV
jgi:hypothetical protein